MNKGLCVTCIKNSIEKCITIRLRKELGTSGTVSICGDYERTTKD